MGLYRLQDDVKGLEPPRKGDFGQKSASVRLAAKGERRCTNKEVYQVFMRVQGARTRT